MEAHVRLNLGNRANITEANIIDWLNFSLEDMTEVFNWKAMLDLDTNTVKTRADANWYAMPQRVKDIFNVEYVDGINSRTLIYKKPDILLKQTPHPENDGSDIPFWYTWQGDYLKLYPRASLAGKQIQIFCLKWPERFDANEDAKCPLPRMEKTLIARASWYGATTLMDFKKIQVYISRYNKGMKRAAQSETNISDFVLRYGTQRLSARTEQEGLHVDLAGAGVTI